MRKYVVVVASIVLFSTFTFIVVKGAFLYSGSINSGIKKTENISGSCANIDDAQKKNECGLSLLPKEIALYKIIENGYNPGGFLYSVNVYFPDDTYQKWKNGEIEQDPQKNLYVGSWVVNLQSDTVRRLASVPGDYNFSRWVNNDEVELLSDGNVSATIYNALTGEVVSKKAFNLDTSADVSTWSTYRNEALGFEVKYPKGFIVKEINKSEVSEHITNRYVSFSDPDTKATFFLGVKRESEISVMPKSYRTGIPGGDFFSRGTVAFGNTFAQELELIDCYFPEENRCIFELIWFCGVNDDFVDGRCDNIQLDSQKSAFMEVTLTKESDVTKVRGLAHGMIRTFRSL